MVARPVAQQADLAEALHGKDLASKTILLHAEQGFGDTIQFVRYLPMVAGLMVASLGAKIILEAPGSLLPLLGDIDGVPRW